MKNEEIRLQNLDCDKFLVEVLVEFLQKFSE